MQTTAASVIIDFRRVVTTLVSERCSSPVYSFLPDDVAHLPVLVVGRPSIRESLEPGVMTASLDVVLLGRRISDEDSQRELDALGDELFLALGGTKNVKVDATYLRCTSLLPGTVPVAGQEYPAYIATVSMDTITC